MRCGIRRFQQSLAALLLIVAAAPAAAQTDYYNTDRSRPTRVEDAHATELYALEIKVAPLRIDQIDGEGLAEWSLLPEIAYGVLPRTAIEVGMPITALADGPVRVSGIEFSAFHNVNTETLTLPALALRADLEVPLGSEESGGVVPSLTGIVTRTFRQGRVHLNGRYSLVDEGPEATEPHEGRWLAGVAVDHVLPLRAMLLIANVYAVQPVQQSDLRWTAGAGVRYQLNPYLAVDAGAGREFGSDGTWHLTVGSALHLGTARAVRGMR